MCALQAGRKRGGRAGQGMAGRRLLQWQQLQGPIGSLDPPHAPKVEDVDGVAVAHLGRQQAVMHERVLVRPRHGAVLRGGGSWMHEGWQAHEVTLLRRSRWRGTRTGSVEASHSCGPARMRSTRLRRHYLSYDAAPPRLAWTMGLCSSSFVISIFAVVLGRQSATGLDLDPQRPRTNRASYPTGISLMKGTTRRAVASASDSGTSCQKDTSRRRPPLTSTRYVLKRSADAPPDLSTNNSVPESA